MELKELRTQGTPELRRTLAELKEELRDLRFKALQHQLKDVRRIREVKHVIARALTLLTQRKEKSA